MGLPAARISDNHVCKMVSGAHPHVGGPITSGCNTVLIGGKPAARIGDSLICHGPTDHVATGVNNVLIGGKPAARITDRTVHNGVIVHGCTTVLIGGQSSGSGGQGDSNTPGESAQDPGGDLTTEPMRQLDQPQGEMTTQTMGQLNPSDGEMTSQTMGQLASPQGEAVSTDATSVDQGTADTFSGPVDTNPGALKAEVFSTTDTPPETGFGGGIGSFAGQVGNFAGQVGTGLADGVVSEAGNALQGALQTVQQVYNLSTSQTARDAFGQQAVNLAGQVGQAATHPVQTWGTLKAAVTQTAQQFQQDRNAAYLKGQGAAFDAKIAGRAIFQLGATLIPAAGGAKLIANARRYINLAQGAREAGITRQAAISLDKIARTYKVNIDMRPTNPGARRLIEAGYSPKPEWLKAKTINDLDKHIGAPLKGEVGEAAFFEPKRPNPALEKADPQLYERAYQRYEQRLEEQKLYGKTVQNKLNQGEIEFRDGRLINKASNTPYAGDNDIFNISAADGRELTAAQKSEILGKLKDGPVKAQHGAHMDWNPTKNEDIAMKQKIIQSHMSPTDGGGGQKLSRFGPGGWSHIFWAQ